MAKLRKRLFIDGPVQGSLVQRIALHWGIFFMLVSVSVFTVEWFLGGAQLSFAEHLSQIWTKYAFFFLLMLSVLPAFIYDSIKLSHRFAGPVLRLKDSLKRLADGETVPTLKFRDSDFWRELSDDFNRVATRVQVAEDENRSDLQRTTNQTDDSCLTTA